MPRMGSVNVITLYDETATGERGEPIRLRLVSERITARELVERRVRDEVARYNTAPGKVFRGLMSAPEDAIRRREPMDPDAECARARAAFERNQFFLLTGDRQVESLDEEILLTPGLEVRFVRLVPLVGG